jgi:hypothetical protein
MPEKTCFSVHDVAAILWLQYMVHVILFTTIKVFYCYITLLLLLLSLSSSFVLLGQNDNKEVLNLIDG